MPVGLLAFDDPQNESLELKQDLDTINGDVREEQVVADDLKGSPFVVEPKRQPALIPPPPVAEEEQNEVVEEQTVKPIKPKKPLSEKQKAHLARMRQRKADNKKKKIEKQLEKTDIVKEVEKKMPVPAMPTPDEIEEMDKQEFEVWLKYMDRFDRITKAIEKDKQRKLDAEQKKEKEIEDRIRKKMEAEYQQRSGHKAPQQQQPVPELINQTQNPFGEYSNMFGY